VLAGERGNAMIGLITAPQGARGGWAAGSRAALRRIYDEPAAIAIPLHSPSATRSSPFSRSARPSGSAAPLITGK